MDERYGKYEVRDRSEIAGNERGTQVLIILKEHEMDKHIN